MYGFWDKVLTPTGKPGYILAQEETKIGDAVMYGIQLNKSDFAEEEWKTICPSNGPNKLFYYLGSEISHWKEEDNQDTKKVSSTGKVRMTKEKASAEVAVKAPRKPRKPRYNPDDYDG